MKRESLICNDCTVLVEGKTIPVMLKIEQMIYAEEGSHHPSDPSGVSSGTGGRGMDKQATDKFSREWEVAQDGESTRKDRSEARHTARNDYQDSGGSLPNGDRSKK